MLLLVQLAFGVAVVLTPGALVARALGVRRLSAALAWSLAVVFGALVVTFAVSASLDLTLALLLATGIAAIPFALDRDGRAVPGRWSVFGAGALLGLLLWHVAGNVGGDGFFHLGRVQKLLAFGDLSVGAMNEFPDGGPHPGYAVPLWHGVLALVAKVSGADPVDVVLHGPTVLAPLAALVGYEAGWALFRRVVPGDNPDLELPLTLSREGCPRVPAPVAWMVADLGRAGEPDGHHVLGVLQPFLHGAADGWELALSMLAKGEDFTAEARALGRATAEVHTALTRALPTVTLGRPQLEALVEGMTERLEAAAQAVPALRPYAPGLHTAFEALADLAAEGRSWTAQRIHGDLHLGQCLRSPSGEWSLIDFEGEPSKPLAERRMPQPVARDIAGMRYWPRLIASGRPGKGPQSPMNSERIVITTYTGASSCLAASSSMRANATASSLESLPVRLFWYRNSSSNWSTKIRTLSPVGSRACFTASAGWPLSSRNSTSSFLPLIPPRALTSSTAISTAAR